MKKGLKTGLIILSLISVAGIAASIMCLWGNNTAVSIIGGADGPTSIFIAGKIGNSTVIYIVTGLCIIATAALECLPLSADINSSWPEVKKNEDQDCRGTGYNGNRKLIQSAFSAMAALQPDFISPAFADRAFIRKNIEETESDILIAEENGNTEGFLLIQEKRLPL